MSTTKQTMEFIEKAILDKTTYVPVVIDDTFSISASMIGKEDLQNYLTIMNREPNRDSVVGDNTLGSILHLGMEKLFSDSDYVTDSDIEEIMTEESAQMTLENGWVLTCTADLGIIHNSENMTNLNIYDYKFTKKYTKKMFEKTPIDHAYTKQILAMLSIFSNSIGDLDNISGSIAWFIKDTDKTKGEKVLDFTPVIDQPMEEFEEIRETFLAEVVEQTNRLQEYFDKGIIPSKCEDTWIRRLPKTKQIIHAKCEYYCDMGSKGLCPYYNRTTKTLLEQVVQWT